MVGLSPQLWDVEQKRNMTSLLSHLSVVRALSWKQQLLTRYWREGLYFTICITHKIKRKFGKNT